MQKRCKHAKVINLIINYSKQNVLRTSVCPEMNIEVIVRAETLATVVAFSRGKNFQLHLP